MSFSLTPAAKQCLRNYRQPYQGFTTDGKVIQGLWKANSQARGPTKAMVDAAQHLLQISSIEEKQRFRHLITAREWRSWSNPEIITIDSGLRVVDMAQETRDAVLGLLRTSLSTQGYEKVHNAMATDSYIDSYQFCMFGEPAVQTPWGFNLFGRNVCLNVFTLDGELVIGPFQVSTEESRRGSYGGGHAEVLEQEKAVGLALIKSLSLDQRHEANFYGDFTGETCDPSDKWSIGGAHQDNKATPYSGICAADLDPKQQQTLLGIVRIFNELLPDTSLDLMMERVKSHLHQTYLCWDGSIEEDSPFYYRIHSPIIMNEFNRIAGSSLFGELPQSSRLSAIQRLPNRGDYGAALLDDWIRQVHANLRHEY